MSPVTVTVVYGPGMEPPTNEVGISRAKVDAMQAYESRHGHRAEPLGDPVVATEGGYPALRWTFPHEESA